MATRAASLERKMRRRTAAPFGMLTFSWIRRRLPATSLHRHTLRKVARLVDVGALQHCHMIGQQLHRYGIDQRCNERMDLGHLDGRKATLSRFSYALGVADQNDLPAPRAHFLHVADGLLE